LAAAYAEYSASYSDFGPLMRIVDQFQRGCRAEYPILDAGCGTGRDARKIASSGRTVIALDASHELLGAWPQQSDCPRVAADLRRLPFRAQAFGGVLMCASLIHVLHSQIPSTLRGVHYVLAPGGLFLATVRNQGHTGWTEEHPVVRGRRWQSYFDPQWLTDELQHSGFVRVRWWASGGNWLVIRARKR
jgi:SAM-dependent methyltransferase